MHDYNILFLLNNSEPWEINSCSAFPFYFRWWVCLCRMRQYCPQTKKRYDKNEKNQKNQAILNVWAWLLKQNYVRERQKQKQHQIHCLHKIISLSASSALCSGFSVLGSRRSCWEVSNMQTIYVRETFRLTIHNLQYKSFFSNHLDLWMKHENEIAVFL